jgi:hypothetical protein
MLRRTIWAGVAYQLMWLLVFASGVDLDRCLTARQIDTRVTKRTTQLSAEWF